jgi:hypothetical protein
MAEQVTQIEEIAGKLMALGDDARAATEGSARNILIIDDLSSEIGKIDAKFDDFSTGASAVRILQQSQPEDKALAIPGP